MTDRVYEFSSPEELFHFSGLHACLYCRKSIPMTDIHLSKRHLKFAINYTEAGISKLSIPCYCPSGKDSKRSHWHCTKCPKIIGRTEDFRQHLSNHGAVLSQKLQEKVFEFSCTEELFSFSGEHACQYCTKSVAASAYHLSTRHLKFAVHYINAGTGKFSIPCYCPDGRGIKRSHWHCPKCPKIIARTEDFRPHLSNHDIVVIEKSVDEESAIQNASSVIDPMTVNSKFSCQSCGIIFTSLSHLRRHKKQHKGRIDSQPMICVDRINGIYVTPKNTSGAPVPIHVCKSCVSQTFLCELESCMRFMRMAGQRGNPGKECRHLERTRHAQCYSPPPALCHDFLQEMVNKGMLSMSSQEECMQLNALACLVGVDCVFPIFWEDQQSSKECIFFSVYTSKKDNWCRFGRTCVSLDIRFYQWHCQCMGMNSPLSCVHTDVCMWWVFQERPNWQKHGGTNTGAAECKKEVIEPF